MFELNTMTIIIATVVFVTLTIIGILVGMSVHREATRLRRRRLHREEQMLAQLRDEDLAQRRYTLDDVRRRTHGTWV